MPDPTPRPTPTIHDSILQGAGGNLRDQSSNDRSLSGSEDGQAIEIKALKAQVKKLKRKSRPVINHHKAWLRATRLKKRRGVFKQGRKVVKSSKEEPSAHKDPAFKDDFEDLLDDAMDYQGTEDGKDKESTDLHQGTDKEKVSTDTQKVSTDRAKEGTDTEKVSIDNTKLSTDKVEEDDETIAKVLLNMSQAKAVSREKEKGVELKDVETIKRPRSTSTRSVLTLKPLPKIDPKDKGKKRIEEEESDTASDDIDETEKKFKILAHDEEIARKMQEDWEVEEEKQRLAKEEAAKDALIQDFNDIQARIDADRILAERLQEEEREQFTMEERANFLHDTIDAQRRFLAQHRSEAIRNKPPTRTQLRNQMMNYLKHVGNKKHSDLKKKTFDEIQVLYERIKRNNDKFLAVGSIEDERKIKEMNEKAKDPGRKRLKKKVVQETPKEEDTTKVPAKHEVIEQGTKKRKSGHIKMIARKRPRPQPNDDSDNKHRKCLRVVALDSVIDSEVLENKSVIARVNKVSSPDRDYLVIYRANGNFRAFNYLLEVLHIFDRQDLFHLYDLVMKQYSEVTLEGFELILWGDLKIMMESSIEENDQMCILELQDGTIIHMLVERRYPLSKDLLQRMIDLGLEVEKESTAALHLIRLSIHLVVYNEELAIPEQTATGKGTSNPLLAGSLPKTTKPTHTPYHNKKIEFESNQNNAVAKIPLLKQSYYDTWKIKINQFFQIQDYALWEVIEYGNSFKPTTKVTTNADGSSTSTIVTTPVTTDEKIQKKNDVKARSMLLMALPNEHLLTFSQYKDAKTLFESIQARFGGNEATKKTQKMFQKLVSQLAILGENISQEDLNLKFLRSLPTEWNTHVIVWRNKPDIGMMNIDELYNNFKIVEQEVKRSGASSSDPSIQNAAFVSTPNNSNDAKPISVQVSTASTPISTQIHDDDLEEMDLKWNMALISMRARKFYHRTGRKLVIDGGDTAGFDKSKIECFNCHKLGHFARECKGPRHQDNRSRSQDFRLKSQESSKKTVSVEETSPTAMIAFDGGGFDWSYMAEEEAPTNIALTAFSDSEDSEIDVLKTLVEKLKKEKEGIKIKVDGFENASKNLDTLVSSQISINKNKGIGFHKYNAVAPPPTGMFAPPTVDLSNSGLKEFEQPEFLGYGAKANECVNEKSSNEPKKHPEAPIIEDWITDNEDDEPEINVVEKVQTDNKQAEEPRKSSETPRKSSWTKPISKKSGVGYPFKPKACFVCGSFSHLIKDCDFHDKRMAQKSGLNNGGKGTGIREARPVWTNAMRINHQNFSTSRRNLCLLQL
ncbi:putative ribonuclease H-like domain-containing protein [Tanacetum coccineum]